MFLIGSHAAELRGHPFYRPTWQSDIDLYASRDDVVALVADLEREGAFVSPTTNDRLMVSRRGMEIAPCGRARRLPTLDIWMAPQPVLDALQALPDNMGVIMLDRAVQVVSAQTDSIIKEVCRPIPNTRREKHNADIDFYAENNWFGSERTAAHEQFAEAFGAALGVA